MRHVHSFLLTVSVTQRRGGGVLGETANGSGGCGPLHVEEEYSTDNDTDYYEQDYIESLAVEGEFDPSKVKEPLWLNSEKG